MLHIFTFLVIIAGANCLKSILLFLLQLKIFLLRLNVRLYNALPEGK